MKELFVFMSSAIPLNQLLTDIVDSITEYKINPTEDNLKKVELMCILLNTKTQLKGSDPLTLIDELNKQQRANDLLTPKGN